jgi:uncharacterized protein YprB with RNaseH-like and TPR domain
MEGSSKLTDRLRGILHGSKPVPRPEGPAERAEPPLSLARVLGAEWTEHGPTRALMVERRVDRDAVYGDRRVEDRAASLERSMGCAALLMRNTAARPPFIFFDLETTGLSGGAGTYAFVVGCGWFAEDGGFVTRQYVLADSGDERGMLEAVAADFGRAGILVSFNGKSFDAPLLETRFQFHRLDWIGAAVPHLDVLHSARRFWGGGEGQDHGCSLGALEQRLLGAARVDDVAGFDIPHRYFQFVRSGNAEPLSGVLEHNRRDLMSLAALTARLLELIDLGSDEARDAREALALGRVFASSGLNERARDAYRRAVALSDPAFDGQSGLELRVGALRALALAERRARAYEAAAPFWQQLVDLQGCPTHIAAEAAEALAIHHEHRLRDFTTARSFALRSLSEGSRSRWSDAVRHRLDRLERKLERPTEPLLFPSWSLQPSSGSPTSARRTSS